MRIETWIELHPVAVTRPKQPGLSKTYAFLAIDDPDFSTKKWRLKESILTSSQRANGVLRVLALDASKLPPARADAWAPAQQLVDDFCLAFSWVTQFPMHWLVERFTLDRMAPPRFWENQSLMPEDSSKQLLDAIAEGRTLTDGLRFKLEVYRASLAVARKERFVLMHTLMEAGLGTRALDADVAAALEAVRNELDRCLAGRLQEVRERVRGVFENLKQESLTTQIVRHLVEGGYAANAEEARTVPRTRGAIVHGQPLPIDGKFDRAEEILSKAVESRIEAELMTALGFPPPQL